MKAEHHSFYRDILQNLQSQSLAIFAGAGLSKDAGTVDWKGLLRDIARDLGLNIDQEYDLISIAQYNVNKIGGRSMINQQIISEFNRDIDLTENHRILARLPIHTYWTTNYDDLIEKALHQANRVADVKHDISQLNYPKPRRDAIVYKMHGDATMPNNAVITKDDYESYSTEKTPFVTALSGYLVSKLFVFAGFSFTDPNLDYVMSRVRLQMKNAQHHHYFFIKKVVESDFDNKADFEYQLRKQMLFVDDLKRFKLQPVYIDTYPEITSILKEIEELYKRNTVLISGSAEEYGAWDRNTAQEFIHLLSNNLVTNGFRIVNGFGWGVGSAVINGALEAINGRPDRHGQDQLIMKPFPQFKTGAKELTQLWEEYRHEMISHAGIAIFLFGNKLKPGTKDIIDANGLLSEFQIAKQKGLFLLPVGNTGYLAEKLYRELNDEGYYATFVPALQEKVKQLIKETEILKIVKLTIEILKMTQA